MQINETFKMEKDEILKRLKKRTSVLYGAKNLTMIKRDFPRNSNGKVNKRSALEKLRLDNSFK